MGEPQKEHEWLHQLVGDPLFRFDAAVRGIFGDELADRSDGIGEGIMRGLERIVELEHLRADTVAPVSPCRRAGCGLRSSASGCECRDDDASD